MTYTMWNPISTPPGKAGHYIVGNRDSHVVGQARWKPKKKEWKFPSASMAFEIQAWTEMPGI